MNRTGIPTVDRTHGHDVGSTGLDFDARRAARSCFMTMKHEVELNEKQNEDIYRVLPKTKKDALEDYDDHAVLLTILEGLVRKMHFTSLYLMDKCLVKEMKPVVYSYCHDYGAFFEHNCFEIKRSVDVTLSSLVAVHRSVQKLQLQKEALNEKCESLIQALATANKTMELSLAEKDSDIMDNIPQHIKEEMESRLKFEEWSRMFKLPELNAPVLANIAIPTQLPLNNDTIPSSSNQLGNNTNVHEEMQHHRPTQVMRGGRGQQIGPAKSPRHGHASTTSPRAKRIEQQHQQQQQSNNCYNLQNVQQRIMPPGYKTREQIEKENAVAAAREAYLQNASKSSNQDNAAKMQYELEKGYMSKHHIASIEHQIKKMQIELEKAKYAAMTSEEKALANRARRLKAGKAVDIWTMTPKELAGIRIKRFMKKAMLQIKRLRQMQTFFAKKIQQAARNYLTIVGVRRGVKHWCRVRLAKLILYWAFIRFSAKRKARKEAAKKIQRALRRFIFHGRAQRVARIVRRAVVNSVSEFNDFMLARLERRLDKIETVLTVVSPSTAAQSVLDRITTWADRSISAEERLQCVQRLHQEFLKLRGPSEEFSNRLAIVEDKLGAIQLAISSALRVELLAGKGQESPERIETSEIVKRYDNQIARPSSNQIDARPNSRYQTPQYRQERPCSSNSQTGTNASPSPVVGSSRQSTPAGTEQSLGSASGNRRQTTPQMPSSALSTLLEASVTDSVVSEEVDPELDASRRVNDFLQNMFTLTSSTVDKDKSSIRAGLNDVEASKYQSLVTIGNGLSKSKIIEKLEKLRNQSSIIRAHKPVNVQERSSEGKTAVYKTIDTRTAADLLKELETSLFRGSQETVPMQQFSPNSVLFEMLRANCSERSVGSQLNDTLHRVPLVMDAAIPSSSPSNSSVITGAEYFTRRLNKIMIAASAPVQTVEASINTEESEDLIYPQDHAISKTNYILIADPSAFVSGPSSQVMLSTVLAPGSLASNAKGSKLGDTSINPLIPPPGTRVSTSALWNLFQHVHGTEQEFDEFEFEHSGRDINTDRDWLNDQLSAIFKKMIPTISIQGVSLSLDSDTNVNRIPSIGLKFSLTKPIKSKLYVAYRNLLNGGLLLDDLHGVSKSLSTTSRPQKSPASTHQLWNNSTFLLSGAIRLEDQDIIMQSIRFMFSETKTDEEKLNSYVLDIIRAGNKVDVASSIWLALENKDETYSRSFVMATAKRRAIYSGYQADENLNGRWLLMKVLGSQSSPEISSASVFVAHSLMACAAVQKSRDIIRNRVELSRRFEDRQSALIDLLRSVEESNGRIFSPDSLLPSTISLYSALIIFQWIVLNRSCDDWDDPVSLLSRLPSKRGVLVWDPSSTACLRAILLLAGYRDSDEAKDRSLCYLHYSSGSHKSHSGTKPKSLWNSGLSSAELTVENQKMQANLGNWIAERIIGKRTFPSPRSNGFLRDLTEILNGMYETTLYSVQNNEKPLSNSIEINDKLSSPVKGADLRDASRLVVAAKIKVTDLSVVSNSGLKPSVTSSDAPTSTGPTPPQISETMTLFEYQKYLKEKHLVESEAQRRVQEVEDKKIKLLEEAAALRASYPSDDIRLLNADQLYAIEIPVYLLILCLLEKHTEQSRTMRFVVSLNELFHRLDSSKSGLIVLSSFLAFVRSVAVIPISSEIIEDLYNQSISTFHAIRQSSGEHAQSSDEVTEDNNEEWKRTLCKIWSLESTVDTMGSPYVMTFPSFCFAVFRLLSSGLVDPNTIFKH